MGIERSNNDSISPMSADPEDVLATALVPEKNPEDSVAAFGSNDAKEKLLGSEKNDDEGEEGETGLDVVEVQAAVRLFCSKGWFS
ncbi:hypothetical protein BGZ75_002367 [Mortierella antarctica]|nr:hypothetical protein BGZ75_002367 [Mortierella antarctica]